MKPKKNINEKRLKFLATCYIAYKKGYRKAALKALKKALERDPRLFDCLFDFK